jgi:uncharacterized membrane protein
MRIYSAAHSCWRAGRFYSQNICSIKWPKLHRYAGRIYVGLLLLVSAPSGFVMGFHANGGWAAQASFFVLTPLWWWFTWQGFDTARKRQFAQHQKLDAAQLCAHAFGGEPAGLSVAAGQFHRTGPCDAVRAGVLVGMAGQPCRSGVASFTEGEKATTGISSHIPCSPT